MKENRIVRALLILVCLFAVLLPVASAPIAPSVVSFAVLGDAGCGCQAQQDTANRMLIWNNTKPFRVVLMLGDNIYGEDRLLGLIRTGKKGGDPGLFASRFDGYYKPLLDRGVKFYAVLGNHDLEADGGKAMVADQARFHILGERGYYSFSPEGQESLLEYFALNSNTLNGGRKDPQQLQWLAQALSASHARWKIVYAHHPLYSSPGAHGANAAYRESLEKIMTRGGVRVFLAGHNHFYERLKPQNGIYYFISGGGGRELRTPSESGLTDRAAGVNHFLYFEARPDKLEFWAVSAAGSLLDRGIIPLQ